MAEPIANDWKAIRDRMQQIKSEESASSRPCPRCKDRGWMPNYGGGGQRAYKVSICDLCHNPNGLPPPVAPEVGFGRGLTNWPSVCVHS
jgi:hypothetical protein